MSKKSASLWKKFYKKNIHFHKAQQRISLHLVPKYASVLEIGSKCGELLQSLPNKEKLGVVLNNELLKMAKRKKSIPFMNLADFTNKVNGKYDYIIISHAFSDISDVQSLIKKIKKVSHDQTRIIVFSFNFLWKPALDIAEALGQKYPYQGEPNWLSQGDIDNFFHLENFEKIKGDKSFVFPINIPFLTEVINKYVSPLPLLNQLCLISYAVYKPIQKKKDYSASIVIPARNEAGNMEGVLSKIPKFGIKQEVIFVEGHSEDNTYKTIKNEIKNYKGPIKARLFKQKGKGKGDAVRLGFNKAENELLMILDADLTVDPKELSKFYEAAAEGKGDLIMGSRLVYPMEKQAMRALNYLGNKFFSWAFTFLLGQRVKDTLCGTKVLLKRDYEKIVKNRKLFGDFDPFGDFDLIFGAAKLNMKIIEIPIRYKERIYGKTNISRFTHGLLLLKMVYFAAKNLKFK